LCPASRRNSHLGGADDRDSHLGHRRLERRRWRGSTGSLRRGTEERHRSVAVLWGGKAAMVER
jgi:hypothetical protein